MSVIDLRAAMVTAFQTAIGTAGKVRSHGGRFTIADLKRYALQGPAVLVAFLGMTDIKSTSEGVKTDLVMGAFVVSGDRAGTPRDVMAVTLTAAILPIIPDNDFAIADAEGGRMVRADNLYSQEGDKSGIALWGITWRQKIVLNPMDAATLDDFINAHIDYDLVPTDGTPDATDELTLAT